jgi:peroxiredoxin
MILALTMIVSVLAGCGNDEPAVETTAPVEAGNTETYLISVRAGSGMLLSGVEVYVYADNTLSDLKFYGETDANGQLSLSMPASESYAFTLSGLSKGYDVQPYYTFNGTTAVVSVNTAVVAGESMSGAKLGLGDIMYDFSVTTPYGETVTLSEVLKQKEVVILNFWYNGCSACEYEFPYMQEAYEMYEDKVAVIAVDPLFDSASTQGYQESRELTFTMASVPSNWTTAFDVNGGDVDAYPTTVIIDRYGMICMIEEGALVNLRYWTSIFSHFTGEDYEQRLIGTADELLTRIEPTSEMPASEEIAAILNNGDIAVSYRADEDAYSWPFIIGEKIGEACVYASNIGIDDSYAILYADVELKAGQAVAIDYLVSSERGLDLMYVIVDGEDIYAISGVDEVEAWKTCYPWVATEDGTYEVALCYLKDESNAAGDDTVYVKNLRVVDVADIDMATYLPRNAYTSEDGFAYTYPEIFLNEADGYYHVGSENGPLLMANLMMPSEFNEEKSIFDISYDSGLKKDGQDLYELIVDYCSFASNANLYGYCTVNQELYDLLTFIDEVMGFETEDTTEWLRCCKYYDAYGTDIQMEDPIKGLAPFSAYKAELGVNVPTNYFYYNRAIIPRGLLAEFTPSRSGVYRITSHNDSTHGVEAWIFNENREEIFVYEPCERMFNEENEISMLFYMEAGESYYIDIAFWDMYEVGYIQYDIEYVGATYELFRTCAPGFFTYDTNATGDAMYYLITGGIDVVLGTDGKYYEDKGLDANGNQIYGSLIYCDFIGMTSLFSNPIASVDANGKAVADIGDRTDVIKGLIDMGGFDFSKTEDDLYVLAYLEKHNGDVEATDAYLREMWGEEYDQYAELYLLEDVYEGIYHGAGEDLTEEMRAYYKDIINLPGEKQGCVVVTERLAEILQMLMDKYTFKNVEDAWTKMCYYYQYLGPET